ncbi:hypothetical protein F5141DRAFT_1209354 [Pisolithus sp. B1]|nr:hypothetical protein F5141DRAFT_1209354 [Pisolithus sp. B1]
MTCILQRSTAPNSGSGAPMQNGQEGKPIPNDALPANTRVSDLATDARRSSVVLDSEDEDYHERFGNMAQRSRRAASILDVQTKMLSLTPRVHIPPILSRVRITAGVRRHRRLSDGLSSNASSVSGSPSSSISAPLRTHDDNSEGSKGWGPLGRRVNFLVSQGTGARRSRTGAKDAGSGKSRKMYSSSLADSVDERSPLVSFYTGYLYTTVDRNEVLHPDQNVECEQLRRGQVIDATFGEWPWRLLNRHVRVHFIR